MSREVTSQICPPFEGRGAGSLSNDAGLAAELQAHFEEDLGRRQAALADEDASVALAAQLQAETDAEAAAVQAQFLNGVLSSASVVPSRRDVGMSVTPAAAASSVAGAADSSSEVSADPIGVSVADQPAPIGVSSAPGFSEVDRDMWDQLKGSFLDTNRGRVAAPEKKKPPDKDHTQLLGAAAFGLSAARAVSLTAPTVGWLVAAGTRASLGGAAASSSAAAPRAAAQKFKIVESALLQIQQVACLDGANFDGQWGQAKNFLTPEHRVFVDSCEALRQTTLDQLKVFESGAENWTADALSKTAQHLLDHRFRGSTDEVFFEGKKEIFLAAEKLRMHVESELGSEVVYSAQTFHGGFMHIVLDAMAPDGASVWGADLHKDFCNNNPGTFVERVRFGRRPSPATDQLDISAHFSVVPYWASSSRATPDEPSPDEQGSSSSGGGGSSSSSKAAGMGAPAVPGGAGALSTAALPGGGGSSSSAGPVPGGGASSNSDVVVGSSAEGGSFVGSVLANVHASVAKVVNPFVKTLGGPNAEQHLMSASVSLHNFDSYESTQSFFRGADCGHGWLPFEVNVGTRNES